MMPNRHALVKEQSRQAPLCVQGTRAALVPEPLRLEGACDHLFTHAVEQGKG